MLASFSPSNHPARSRGRSRSSRRRDLRPWALLLGLGVSTGCAPREYLTPSGFADIRARGGLELVRVYPSAKFITVYSRRTGEGYDIERTQGAVVNTYEGRRIEAPIPRNLRGAVLAVDQKEGRDVLWVTFDPKCEQVACSYGFVLTEDGLYRLFETPNIENYAEPVVYRKRISRRKRMKKTKVFSRSRSVPAYFTTRGITASIALEIKRQEKVDVETITVESKGIPGQIIVDPEAPQ